MSRQGGLHGDLCSFPVAYFADHDDVRVLPQNGAQCARERHVDARIDLRLPNSGQVVLDWILHREHVCRRGIDPRKHGVQRCGFAAAGRAGHQHDAMALTHQHGQCVERIRRHPEVLGRERAALLVQKAQNDTLAVRCGQSRYAHVNRASTQTQHDTAILRQALFSDIEIGHDLDS